MLLLHGDEHTGKTNMVLNLCEMFQLHYYKVGNSIKEVRKLLSLMAEDSNTIYHFKDFHKASVQARNALLKITEEPVKGNYIVITGSTQLKTLESRARKIVMNPYSKEEVLDYMEKYFPNYNLRLGLYNSNINTPAKVHMYKDYENINKLYTFTEDIANRITYLTTEDVTNLVALFHPRYEQLDACLLFLNMLIGLIETNIKLKHNFSYYDILDILIEGKNNIIRENTLNRKLLLFGIFFRISKL